MVQWVFDYLLRRQQRTVVSGSSSSWATVISGVPQGSVLGPLLFILFINDVTIVRLSVNSDLNLYADDMVLYKPVRSAVDATEFQEDINLIANFVKSVLLQLNVSKTKFMVLTRAKPAKSITSTPTLYNIPLEQVDAFTYLGVLISANMSWGPHIEAITSKSKRILGALYHRYYAHCSSKILLKLYTAYVRPRLEYVSYVWDSSTQKHINQLEKVQKFALKMCYKKWSSSYSHLLEVAQLPTLEVRRRVSKFVPYSRYPISSLTIQLSSSNIPLNMI